VESVLAQLYARADYDMSVAERGIVYIDEIDKVQNIPRIPHHYLLLLLVKRFLYFTTFSIFRLLESQQGQLCRGMCQVRVFNRLC
jgi:hypothetical protein